MSEKRYIIIPKHTIGDFGFRQFAEHVLDNAELPSRSVMRLVMRVVDGIAAAVDGVAELDADAATAFARACDSCPLPRLTQAPVGASGKPILEMATNVPARQYEPFYQAVESMADERPDVQLATAAE